MREFEVHTGHWSDEGPAVYPIATLAAARSKAKAFVRKYGQAVIWEQTADGVSYVESWS